jgi:GST-like protein
MATAVIAGAISKTMGLAHHAPRSILRAEDLSSRASTRRAVKGNRVRAYCFDLYSKIGAAARRRGCLMIDLYYWTTPNGHKITIFLEEAELPYRLRPVNIGRGDQFAPAFLAISPNNRIPAIVDSAPNDCGAPISVFESGAILLYLAETTGKFLSSDLRVRVETLEWLFWQVGGLGPMAGQNHHFRRDAAETLDYAIARYTNETNRLYAVLNKRLADRPFVAGPYSIADMAIYPWIVPFERQGQRLADFPALEAWFARIAARPAVQRAYALADEIAAGTPQDEAQTRKILYGQTAAVVR